jgi:shikimate 5-dehydrogenase
MDVAAVVSVIDDPKAALDKCCALGEINYPLTDTELAENLADAREVLKIMPKDTIVSDVMLREGDTATISEAKKAGFPTLDGRPMVLYQAIKAFWLVNQDGLEAKDISEEQVAKIMMKAAQE